MPLWMLIPVVTHFATGMGSMISVIDNVLEIVRSQHGPAITTARVLVYAVSTVTIDEDGTLRANLTLPDDCTPEMLKLLRTECAELLPVSTTD
jgi:hypothetical protein